MNCFVGFGSNLGDRHQNFERAAEFLSRRAELRGGLRVSPVLETPPLLPEGAPWDWHKTYLNAVVEFDWDGSAPELLRALKAIEREMGRTESDPDGPRWAPRVIDLDILVFGNETVNVKGLIVPHPGIWDRQFVLSALKHLRPSLRVAGHTGTVLERTRGLPGGFVLWMGIFNLTPDSFSDGGNLATPEDFRRRLAAQETYVAALDFGAESTRPGATPVAPEVEGERLFPALEFAVAHFGGRRFRPWISVDTYHTATARRALELGADMINDVSGLADDGLLELLAGSECQYVLMHGSKVSGNPCAFVKQWATTQLARLDAAGICADRIFFDPGIGFGKNATQSMALLQGIDQFLDLPVRILVGHSRKSFLSPDGTIPARNRDWETLGASLQMAHKGVDVLRVHSADLHQRALRSFQEAR